MGGSSQLGFFRARRRLNRYRILNLPPQLAVPSIKPLGPIRSILLHSWLSIIRMNWLVDQFRWLDVCDRAAPWNIMIHDELHVIWYLSGGATPVQKPSLRLGQASFDIDKLFRPSTIYNVCRQFRDQLFHSFSGKLMDLGAYIWRMCDIYHTLAYQDLI